MCVSGDFKTIDSMPVVCGQVLHDRQRHIAIVVKKSRVSVHLVKVRSGMLKLSKCAAKELSSDWYASRYPFTEAIEKLLSMGKRQGMTKDVEDALRLLSSSGKEPAQMGLF